MSHVLRPLGVAKKDATPLEQFLTKNYEAHFKNHHLNVSESEESDLINEIHLTECRRCGSCNIHKRGFTNAKIQRYFCEDCHRSFTALTNTIFENHKISISEWIEFLLYLFSFESTNQIAKSNKNALTTTQFWLQKVFLVLEDYQDNIVLSGTVYLDEMFYTVRKNELILKENGKKYRGISRNKILIGVAYNNDKVYCKVEKKGHSTLDKTWECFGNHIAPGSKLIHDKEKSHSVLIDSLELENEEYDGNDIKQLDDKENPLQPVNHQIDLVRKFLNAHSGFDRADLQGYLNVYAFICNEHGVPIEKVKKMVYLSLNKKITYQYRIMFAHKSYSHSD